MVAMQMLFGLTMFVYSFNSRKFVLKNSLIEILCLLLPFKGLQFILISNRSEKEREEKTKEKRMQTVSPVHPIGGCRPY